MPDDCVISYNSHYYKVVNKDKELKPIFKGTKIENQKILEQVLKERDERLKARN